MANSNQSGDSNKSSGSERGGSGNFSNDPQRASEQGKKGGQQSQGTTHQGGAHQGGSQKEPGESQRGGSGNFADDKEKASEAGRKGGQHSQGGSNK